jgi:DNA helicase-2/ATP-dependent DNA helicase PcrA
MAHAAEIQSDYLELLNPAQRQAASFGQKAANGAFAAGPLLVIAGAGTGKTMTLAYRVAHLVIQGVSPERILLLTFTRRAAQEMTRRVESIVRQALCGSHGPPPAQGILPWSGTFHAVANRLLRRYSNNLGLDPGFSVLDRGDAADLMDVARHGMKPIHGVPTGNRNCVRCFVTTSNANKRSRHSTTMTCCFTGVTWLLTPNLQQK